MHISKVFSFAFAVLASGKPQNPTPTGPAPIPSGPGQEIPPAGTDLVTIPPPSQTASSSETASPASISQAPPGQAGGPICECGYTYCASVLKAMGKFSREIRSDRFRTGVRSLTVLFQPFRGIPSSLQKRIAARPTQLAPTETLFQALMMQYTSVSVASSIKRMAMTWICCVAVILASTLGPTFAADARRHAIQRVKSSSGWEKPGRSVTDVSKLFAL